MRYKGKRIEAPTLEMIREHIERKHFSAILNYIDKKLKKTRPK